MRDSVFWDSSRILFGLFWDYTDRLGFQDGIPFGLRDSIWIMGFHWDYLKKGSDYIGII